MKDFRGQTLEVGDRVAYAQAGHTTLYEGVIIKVTPKGVKVDRDIRAEGVFRYGTDVVKL